MNSVPKFREVMGGPNQRFIVKELYVRDASLQRCGLSNWVWLKVGNQANPLKYSERKVVFHTNLEQMFKCMATDLDT